MRKPKAQCSINLAELLSVAHTWFAVRRNGFLDLFVITKPDQKLFGFDLMNIEIRHQGHRHRLFPEGEYSERGLYRIWRFTSYTPEDFDDLVLLEEVRK